MARPTEDDARKSTGRVDPSSRDYAASEATPNPDDDPTTGEVPVDELSLTNRDRLASDPARGGRAPEDLSGNEQVDALESADEDILDDQDLKKVDEDHIGAGRGLDEAELGREKPLDKKKWDGDPNEPYGTD